MESKIVLFENGIRGKRNDHSVPLGRVESAGGKVILPKTVIGENRDFIALFIDTEGNKVGFHSLG
jgi:predicted enzyme related to lactoylglutathione lyase